MGTSISSLTSSATGRSIPRSAESARTCAFQPESVSTPARRTSAASRIVFIRQRARKNSAPAIQSAISAWGRFRETMPRKETLEARASLLREAAGGFMVKVATPGEAEVGEAEVAIWPFGSAAIRGSGLKCRCNGAAMAGAVWRLLAANAPSGAAAGREDGRVAGLVATGCAAGLGLKN